MFMVWVAMETLWICSHGHLKYGPPGMDDAHLRIAVALPLFVLQRLGDRVVERRRGAHPLGPSEAGLHGPFVLIDREKAAHHV